MASLTLVIFLAVVALVASICDDPQLGLSLRSCMPCGSPGLDDLCIKRQGRCGTYSISSGYTAYGDLGGPNGLPPFGYLNNSALPPSCQTINNTAARIPNRAGRTGTITVYLQAADWGSSLPKVCLNPNIVPFLNVKYPLHQCLENNCPFPNGRWNWRNPYDSRQGVRVDSFFYDDNGNSTWSYQCYCDFCNQCQNCTNG